MATQKQKDRAVQRHVVRNAFDRERVVTKTPGKSLTEQHHARSCDINSIMAKYLKTGVIDHISKYEPQYGDVCMQDYKQAQDLVARVKTEFEELPGYVRARFNDVSHYLALMQTDEGVETLRGFLAPGEQYDRQGNTKPEGRPNTESTENQQTDENERQNSPPEA